MRQVVPLVLAVLLAYGPEPSARAATVTFFSPDQVAAPVSSGTTSDTVSSNGYLFTYTRDKLFTGGVGMTTPIGRTVRVPWPDGLEAQAVTSGPSPGGAKLSISRVDHTRFDLTALTIKLLANTAGAGGAVEVMPTLGGEDGLPNPVALDVTGNYGQSFGFSTSPNPYGQSTAQLVGFDKYTVSLYVDFAVTGLALEGNPVPEPSTGAMAATAIAAGMTRRRRLQRRQS